MQTTYTDYIVLRQSLLAKRKLLPISQQQQGSASVCEKLFAFIPHIAPPTALIAGFWPIQYEIDIKPLLYALDHKGYRLALPRIDNKNSPLHFYAWAASTPMQAGHFNIPEPQQTERIETIPDIVLTPVLGFTTQGDRLGYGKGYYDRTLAQWHTQGGFPYTIGIAWNEGLITENYHAAKHDIPLKAIITPTGWVA